jgi:hypothetical protein
MCLSKLEDSAVALEALSSRAACGTAAHCAPFLFPIAILFTHLLPSSLEFAPLDLSAKVARFVPLLIRCSTKQYLDLLWIVICFQTFLSI